MKLTKKTVMPSVVLGSICLIVAALLAVVNLITYPVIRENTEKAIRASYAEALPEGSVFEDDITGAMKEAVGMPETLTQVIREGTGKGYVLVITTKSEFSKGDLSVTLGVDEDLRIVNMKITSYAESRNIRSEDGTVKNYVGNDYDYLYNNDKVLVSGATFSSTAFRNAVTDSLGALKSYLALKGGENK